MIENIDDWPMFLQATLVAPEYLNFVVLLLAVYGMYQGVEIQHPLYSVLFLNLIIPLCLTATNMIGFVFIPCSKYIILSNSNSAFCIYFHCKCWCLSSIIRYKYIVSPDWIHNLIPNSRTQCIATYVMAFVMSFLLSAPMFSYAIYLGKFHNVFGLKNNFLWWMGMFDILNYKENLLQNY